MKHLPEIQDIRHNQGPFGRSSFIDDEWVWHYIAGGQWTFEIEGHIWNIDEGDSVLLPPRQLHVVRPAGGGTLLQEVVHFTLPEPYSTSDFPPVLSLPPKARRQIRTWFNAIAHMWLGRPPSERSTAGQRLEMNGLMAAILGLHLQNQQHTRPSEQTSATGWLEVTNAVRFLQKNHTRSDLALAEISRAAGVTPNYLCRIFKNHMGGSVIAYLTEYRLKEAEKLLIQTTANCSQIAEHTGFASLHVFSRVFRKRRRISPTDFRARHAPRINS